MLSKQQQKRHAQACELLKKDILTHDDKLFVFENWQESATNRNKLAGAFFTPWELARDFVLEIGNGPMIDLCAGIGVLSYFAYHHSGIKDITCVELNPEYIAVGKKILPEATWIQGSIFDEELLPSGFFGSKPFKHAISNPPFGMVKTGWKSGPVEFQAIERASQLAHGATFILPQMSAPFEYSGKREYKETQNKTPFQWEPNCGIDTSIHQWKGVKVITEVVNYRF